MMIALGVLASVCGLGALLLLPWETLAAIGMWLIVAGFAVGVPTGVQYHIELYKSLKPTGLLPDGWYWRPIDCNDLVPEADRRRVLQWCYAGAAGFAVILTGVVALGAAVAVQWLRH